MIMRYVLLYLVFFMPIVLRAETDARLEAQRLFEQGSFNEALAIYETISAPTCADLVNCGSCYFYADNIVQALVAWHKAVRIASAYEEGFIQELIRKGEQRLGFSHNVSWYGGLVRNMHIYTRRLDLWYWQIFFLTLWYSLFLLWLFFHRRLRLIIAHAVGLTIIAGCLALYYSHSAGHGGVMLQEQRLFAGADERFVHRATVVAGQYVSIQATNGSWYAVRTHNMNGWIPANSLQVITT